MNNIYEWIRNLVCYLIFISMILQLLPDRKYEKYLRLYAGVIFLLLIFAPLTQAGGLEERMAGLFEQIVFQNDVSLLRREIDQVERQQMEQLTAGYEENIEMNIRHMALALSMECSQVEAELYMDPDSEQFGSIRSVRIQISASENRSREQRAEVNRRAAELKKKIGEYYGMEEHFITVTLENR